MTPTGSLDLAARDDAETRQTIARVAWKTAIIGSIALAVSVNDRQPLARLCISLEALAYVAGMVAVATALLSRQGPRGAVLTRWDESLAFGVLSLAAHLGRSFIG